MVNIYYYKCYDKQHATKNQKPQATAEMKINRSNLAVSVFIIASVVYLSKPLPEPIFNDAGLYAYQAQQLLEGIPPYRSVFNGKMPLGTFALIPGILLARLMEWNDIQGIQFTFAFVGGLLVAGLFLLCEAFTRSKSGSFLAAIYFLGFKYFSIHLLQYDPKVISTILQIAFLYCVVNRRYFLSGIAISSAILAWQPAFVLLITGIVGCYGKGWRKTAWNITQFIFGNMIPVFLTISYFVSQGALADFFQSTVMYPLLNHYDAAYIGMKRYHVLTYLAHHPQFDAHLIHIGFIFLIISLFAGMIFFQRKYFRPHVLILISFASVLAWSFWDFGGYPDLSPLLPFSAIGIALAYQLMVQTEAKIQYLFVVGLSVCILSGTFISNRKFDYRAEFNRHLTQLSALVHEHAPDAKIMAYGDPHILALLRLSHPTKYMLGTPGHSQFIDKHYPGGLKQWELDFVNQHAGIVFLGVPNNDLENLLLQNSYKRWGSVNKGRSRVYVKIGNSRSGNE